MNLTNTGIKTSVADHVATIAIDSPETLNAMTAEMLEAMAAAFEASSQNPDVRAIVLRSTTPDVFCSGFALEDLELTVREATEAEPPPPDSPPSSERYTRVTRAHAACIKSIALCPKPVVARVEGLVYGAGLVYLTQCDVGVAVSGVLFRLPELRFGLNPGGLYLWIKHKIRASDLNAYVITGEPFSAEQARQAGFLAEVVPTVQALDKTIERHLYSFKQNSPIAMAGWKAAYLRHGGVDFDQLEAKWREGHRHFVKDSDVIVQGAMAHIEKRKQSWDLT